MKYDLIVCPILVVWVVLIIMVAVRNEVFYLSQSTAANLIICLQIPYLLALNQ